MLTRQPVHPGLRRDVASDLEFVGDEPVAELRIVVVHANIALTRCASSQSRWEIGQAFHL